MILDCVRYEKYVRRQISLVCMQNFSNRSDRDSNQVV